MQSSLTEKRTQREEEEAERSTEWVSAAASFLIYHSVVCRPWFLTVLSTPWWCSPWCQDHRSSSLQHHKNWAQNVSHGFHHWRPQWGHSGLRVFPFTTIDSGWRLGFRYSLCPESTEASSQHHDFKSGFTNSVYPAGCSFICDWYCTGMVYLEFCSYANFEIQIFSSAERSISTSLVMQKSWNFASARLTLMT